MLQAADRRWWRRIFTAFGPLSLSTMAGMSIGGAAFMFASFWAVGRSWKSGGRAFHAYRKEVFSHAANYGGLAIFAAAFLSLLFAWIFPPLGEAASGFAELKKFHHFLYPPFVALALLLTSDSIERHPFWKFWGGMGIFCGIIAGAQYFGAAIFPAEWLGHRFFRSIGLSGRFHGQGLMFFHLSFAACLSFVASAGVARVLWPLKWDSRKDRIFWVVVATAGVLAVYFSFSRIALVGLVMVISLLAFLRKPLWGVIGLCALMAVGSALWFGGTTLRDRFEQGGGGLVDREHLWVSAWAMFEDRPLTGFGFGRSARYTPHYAIKIYGHKDAFTSHAHNNVLDTLASTGAIGLMAYLFWSLSLLVSAWKSFRAPGEKWLPAAALAGLIAFQINGLTQVNFWDGKSQHTLFLWAGIVIALAVRRKRLARDAELEA